MFKVIKLHRILIMLSVLVYVGLGIFEYIVNQVSSAWWVNKGFPLTYESRICKGFNYSNCVTKFYFINLFVDILWPICILLFAYKIGSKHEESKLDKKFVIAGAFVLLEIITTVFMGLVPVVFRIVLGSS